MTPSSQPPSPLPSCPTPSSLLLLLTENGSGKLCEERRGGCYPSQRYPLKFVGHRHDCGNAKEKDSIRRERESPPSPSPLVKTAATPLIGCSSHRNCRCSPTRNHARRIYDLMSSAFSLSLFLVRFFFYFVHCVLSRRLKCRRYDRGCLFIFHICASKRNRGFDKLENNS